MASIYVLQFILLIVLAIGANVRAEDEPKQASRWSLSEAKDYLVNKIKESFINSAGFKESFDETTARIKQRFEKEKLTASPDEDLDVLQYRIAAEEIRGLRSKLEEGGEDPSMITSLASIDPNLVNKCCQHHLDDPESGALACTRCAGTEIDENLIKQKEHGDEEELELMNKLGDLENEDSDANEVEMGWQMDEETKEVLKMRTKRIFQDLLQNELKQLAISLYISKLAHVPLSPIVIVLNTAVQIKILDYLMNCLTDVVPMLFGCKRDMAEPPQHWTKKLFGGRR